MGSIDHGRESHMNPGSLASLISCVLDDNEIVLKEVNTNDKRLLFQISSACERTSVLGILARK